MSETEVHPIALHRLPVVVDEEEVRIDMARMVFRRLNARRHKTDVPIPPIVGEIFGLHKAGKDTQLVKLDRWFRRQGYAVWMPQESAETKDIRSTSRVNPYAYEMRHFAYTFGNLLSAPTSRDYHFICLNRGIIDTLCWLERHKRAGSITEEQYSTAKAFIMNGPWLQTLDVLICLVCDVETSLTREFGLTRPKKYGSRMNPEELALMRECVLFVCTELKSQYPHLPIIQIDTTTTSAEEVSEQIISFLLKSVESRLKFREDDLLLHSMALLRKTAWITGPEIKLRGVVDHHTLRRNGWQLEGATQEEDLYITPKGKTFLDYGECFHLRNSAGRTYFVYKADSPHPRHRAKIHIPIPKDFVKDVLTAFDIVAKIKKKREIFARGGYLLNRDRVEGLGDFTEIKELSVAGEDVLLNIAAELGFEEAQVCTDTYIRLLQKATTP